MNTEIYKQKIKGINCDEKLRLLYFTDNNYSTLFGNKFEEYKSSTSIRSYYIDMIYFNQSDAIAELKLQLLKKIEDFSDIITKISGQQKQLIEELNKYL